MSTAYPYTTNYDAAFEHLELIDIAKVRDGVTVDWFNQTLCQVNDSVIRLGVVKGEITGTSTTRKTSSSSSSWMESC